MIRPLAFILLLATPTDFWQVLAEVGFESKPGRYQEEVPRFSQHLRSWQGKKIRLQGYLVPAGEAGSHTYMFSKLPANVCYFCGGAGPETVVELEPVHTLSFTTQRLWAEGILQLNDRDPDRHMYILREAVITR